MYSWTHSPKSGGGTVAKLTSKEACAANLNQFELYKLLRIHRSRQTKGVFCTTTTRVTRCLEGCLTSQTSLHLPCAFPNAMALDACRSSCVNCDIDRLKTNHCCSLWNLLEKESARSQCAKLHSSTSLQKNKINICLQASKAFIPIRQIHIRSPSNLSCLLPYCPCP